MKKIIGILLLCLCPAVFAYENTYDIFVNRQSVDKTTLEVIKTKGIRGITNAGGQPIREFIILSDWEKDIITDKWYRIQVTCKDSTEASFMANLVNDGKILIHKAYVMDGKKINITKYNNIPADYYEVDLSTH